MRTPFGDRPEDDQVQPGPSSPAIGERLRERRENLGLDLDSIGEALRIKPIYLAALEQGRAQDLPGPTYAVGFIRAYAQYLGLNGERVLDRYKAESAEIHARPDLTLPVPLAERSLPGGTILLVGLILALCGYGTWYYVSTAERSRPERVAAVPAELQPAASSAKAAGARPAADAAGPQLATGLSPPPDTPPPDSATAAKGTPGTSATQTAAAAPPPSSSTPTSGSPPGAAPAPAPAAAVVAASSDAAANSGGGIDIRAVADCWIQVRSTDKGSDKGAIVFSRVLKAGETYHVPRAGLLLRTGNAGALAIVVDGKSAPPLGAVGALRRDVALDPAALLAGTAVHG
jgi:cytoskeleton protein RodZ